MLLAAVLAYLYYLKIVVPVDPNAPNSIDSVMSLETSKPYQFRLLIPAVFFLLKPISFIPQKILFLVYSVIVVYAVILMYRKFLSEYFHNHKAVLFLSPVILYPMLWNYILINRTYQYYDFTSIFIFIIGLYLIIKERFPAFFVLLIIGILNKETSGYLIPAYLLFNYRTVFTKKIIFRTGALIAVYIAIKVLLAYIFRNNPGDNVEICVEENIRIISTIFSNKIYFKHLALNFGGLYIFLFVLFFSSKWKQFPRRNLLLINLAFLPNIILGYFVTYYDEVRVYAEFIPLVTTLFLVYLSTFKKLNLQPAESK
jgi:hypothetical protein